MAIEKTRRIAPAREDALIRRIEELERKVNGAAVATLATDYVDKSDSGIQIPSTATEFSGGVVSLPSGFKAGHFLLFAAAGTTFQGQGNISVAPAVRIANADGSRSAWEFGQWVNSGNADVATAGSVLAHSFNQAANPDIAGIEVGLGTITNGSRQANNAGNWHVSTSFIFKRT